MNSFFALSPLLIIVFASLLVLLLDVFLKKENKNYLAYISLISLVICGFICIKFWNKNYSYFNGNLILDNLSLFFIFILALATGFVILLSMKYISFQDVNYGEFYALLLLALSGVAIMLSSSDLLIIFLGLEVLSICSYALAGLKRKDEKSSEAAIKYFLHNRIQPEHHGSYWLRFSYHRFRFQNCCCSFPYVDSRCLAGCSHTDHCLLFRSAQSSWFYRILKNIYSILEKCSQYSGYLLDTLGYMCLNHGSRKSHGFAPDKLEKNTCLLKHCPRRLLAYSHPGPGQF